MVVLVILGTGFASLYYVDVNNKFLGLRLADFSQVLAMGYVHYFYNVCDFTFWESASQRKAGEVGSVVEEGEYMCSNHKALVHSHV